MNVNLSSLSNTDLAKMCIKYKIIPQDELQKHTREQVIRKVTHWFELKKQKYKSQPKQQDPNVKSIKVDDNKQQQRQRRMSAPQVNKVKNLNGPPKPTVNTRERRMSEPLTPGEKTYAQNDSQLKQQYQRSQQTVQKELMKKNMEKYDAFGIYPPVKRLIAIGDLHGDLRVTLIALKLAGVISKDIFPNNVQDIKWTGGDTWVVQLGDQIDRCRPDVWIKNCISDNDKVIDDEGNNMLIIQIFQKLDAQAKLVGGRVLGMIGNHELMNVDRDFRYVSPKEFLEFVPPKERGRKKTDDGLPYGYYHRMKVFERGGNIAKHYALQKKSITIIGKTLFIHGGLSHDLASKYSLHEMNEIVKKWLLKQSTPQEDEIFDEIFRDDDDMSPFWCRIYGEDEDMENTESNFNVLINTINKRNKLIQPIKGMVIAHTPQFMERKYLNSIYNDRLWRVDVGMSRAFGEHSDCGDDKYRQPQILIIHNDKEFEVRKKPLNSDRYPTNGIGSKIDLMDQKMFMNTPY